MSDGGVSVIDFDVDSIPARRVSNSSCRNSFRTRVRARCAVFDVAMARDKRNYPPQRLWGRGMGLVDRVHSRFRPRSMNQLLFLHRR